MNRLKLLAAAMLLAVPIACGDEVLPPPPTGSIDGLVSIEGQGIDAVSVTLSNGASATTANGGMFRFDGVEAGAYTVTISNYPADASFDQTSAAATIATDGETVTINFPGTFIRTSSIMGTVTVENEGLSGITVKISGAGSSETLTDGNGQYAFTGLRAGNYTIEISGFDDEDVAFGSTASSATLAVGESKVVSFEGTYLRTSGILGQVTADNQPQEAVTVSLQGRGENRSMTTNSAGQYSFDELRSGDYAIGISGYNTDEMSFDVTSKTVTVAYGETATLPFEGTLLRTAGIMGTVTVEGVGPIEDVTVTIQGNGETHEDETNNAGMYSFNRLHAGDYSVTISGFDDDEYGFNVTTATVTVALQDTETVAFDGIMLRTAGISGEVTVGDDDTPLPGVTVTVSGGPRDEDHSATTHSDGTYLVENLHAGDYSVVISGYDTREYGFDPTTETVSVGLRETLEVAFQGTLLRTAGVSGRVSVGGMGIPGVTVTLTGEEDRDPENTNADGQFGFSGLAAGDYTLTISGYNAVEYAFEPTREFELELDESEIENFTGRALRTATVMGYVTVEDAPLPGIDVTLIMVVGTSGEIVGAMPTGETGGYTFGPLLAGAYQVRIGEYDDEYDFAAGDMQGTAVMTDSTATVNFAATIIRTASVSGRVTIDGDPMKDVTVTLTGDHAPDDNSRMTGDYGMYEFDDLRKGDYTLTISGYDAVDYHFEPTGESFALELGGSEIKNFTGKALRTATVMGYVTVENAPLPGIGVTLIMVVGTSGEIVDAKATGDNGGYTFGPLLAGAYQVRIGEYDDEYDFAAGDMQVTAVMTDSTATVNFAATIIRTASVSGMVTIDGEAMKDVTVTISGEHAPADSSMMTGDDGSYSFGGLRKGDYTVTMTNPDGNAYSFPTVATPVNLGVGQEQPGISFAGTRLKRASISGQVHAAGDAVKDVTVTLSGDADGEDVDGEDVTDDNGEYNFPGLAIGSYTVTISGWAEAAYIFNAPASDAEIVNNDDFLIVDFEGEHTKTASIGGMLFIDEGGQTALAHDAGEPVLDLDAVLPEDMPGLPITLLGPELTSPATDGFASREGMYEFPGLQAGTYVINVDVETKIETDPMTNDSATVEDLLAGLGYEYTGPSLILVSVAAAEEKTDVNLPFKITLQTINVGAVMGTPDIATATLVGGVKLALYPTAEAADAGTPILGTARTGADPKKPNHGVAKFEFPRAMDLGPGGTGNDRLVFAKVTSTGHGDLEFSDNRHIEIQYAATDRVSNALTAARLVNVQVNFQWWVKSNADAKDGNEFLGGWVANNGMATDAAGLATHSGRITRAEAIAGASYNVKLKAEQHDSVTGRERWRPSAPLKHEHNHLALPADNTSAMNDYGAIYVTWTTQSLTLGVYREADDVEGYTDYRSALPSGDVRPHPEVGRGMTVELMTRDDDDRLRLYDAWDHDCDDDGEKVMPTKARDAKGDFRAGMITFRCLDVDKEFTVGFGAGDDREQMDYGYDEIETFGDDLDFGVTLGAFGAAMGGAGPEVRMCSASDDTNAEATSDEWCATFAYQWETGTVYGTVGDESGHEVVVDPETGHGAIGDDKKTGRGGAYSIGDLQDGVYTATAASGDDDYQLLTPAEAESFALYHNEACWAATNPEPATGDEQPSSCAADEVEVGEDDDGDTTYTYVNGHEENWRTGRLGLVIRGYVANDGHHGEGRDNLLRGDESMADITMTLRRGTVVRTTKTEASGFYSFDELAEGSYTVSAGTASNAWAIHAINRRPGTQAWRIVTRKIARAEDYTLNPDEADLRKPYWIRSFSSTSGRTMGNGTVRYAPGTGTNPPSDTYYNFALVYTDGQLTGSVNNISGSNGDIDLVFGSPVPYEDDRERTTNNRGNFQISGLLEAIGYTAVIEDAGFAVPCMNAAGTMADDDHVANNGQCRNPAATVLRANVLGADDHQSMGTLYVYSTAASADEELGRVTILGGSTDEGDGFDTTTTWNAGWTREDAEETENTSSIGTTTYKSRTVTVSFGRRNAAIPDGATYSIEANGDDCTGTRCELDADETDDETGEAAAGPMKNTITVTVTAENAYDDHVYSTVVSVAAPVGATFAAANIDATDSEGNELTVDGGTAGALTVANAMTLATAEGETRVNVVFGLTVLGDPEESNAYCAQEVAVTPLNGNALTAEDDEDDDVCEGTRYTLSVPTVGQVYEIDVTSEDDVTVTRYLRVTRGGGTDATNQAPLPVGEIADQEVAPGESATAVDVSGNFSDADGDALTYTAASSADAVATVSVDGSMVTVVGVAAGEAAVTVTATDPGDLSATQMFDVAVAVANQSPEAVGTIADQEVAPGESATAVDVLGNFSDADGDALTYTAASSADAVATVSVDGSMVTVVGVAAGEAAVTVTATDPGDLSATQMFDVTVAVAVANQAPLPVGEIADQEVAPGESATAVDVSGNFNDPDGDALTYTAASSADAFATVSVDGSMVTVAGVAAGEAAVTVTATDPGDLSATQMFDVTVVVAVANQAPLPVGEIADQEVAPGESATAVDVLGNFSDADGDALTYTAASSADAVATVSVDGSMVTVVGVAAGEAAVTVTATDPGDLSATQMFDVTVAVAVANQAPLPVGEIADQEVAPGESATAVDVSGNFNDPDGDALTYTAASSADAFATVSVDGSMVTVVGVAAGEAAVTVTATDPGDLSATQMFDVTVAVGNQSPQAVGTITGLAIAVGATEAVDVSVNFSDADGDELTYTAASSADAFATVSVDGSMVTVVGVAAGEAAVTVTATDPGDLSATQMFDVTVAVGNQSPQAVGTITGLAIAVGATEAVDVSVNFSDADGDELTYTAASSADAFATVSVDGSMVTVVGVAAGEAAVTVTATDPGDLSATQMFDVTVAVGNQSPEAVGTITGLAIAVGATEAVDVSGNFSDADSDTLTYTAASSADAVATVSVDGSMVTVVGVAAGEAAVTVTATDPGDLSATQMFDVTVAVGNQSPEAVGTITGLAIAVGATEAVDVSGNFSDADSDTLTYTAASSADAVATVSVDGSMVTVVGVAAGEAAVTVTATDPGDLSATQMFDVTVAVGNQSPEAVGTITGLAIAVGATEAVDVSGNFSDADSDTLTYTAASSADAVATVSVDGSMVTVVGVAAGEAAVTVTATDPGDLSATQMFDVTVAVGNQSPEAVGTITGLAIAVGATEAVDVSGNFSDADSDTLTYTAASSADAVATVSVDGSMVTVVGVAAGEAAVTVTATDPGDLSATQMFDVTVAVGNQSPEAVGTITGLAIAVGATEAVDVSGNFSDADSDTLTYTAASSADAVATVSVDGSMVTVVGVAAGEAAVTVTATDPGDLSATQMFDVTVAVGNQSPEAVGTITGLAIAVGATEAVDVSGNFSDADSDTLTYTAASSADAVATVSVDGSMVTVVGVAAGEAAVTVTATDPGDLSATQMFDVTVAVGNQSPQAVGTITGLAIAVGATEAVDVSGNFSDADSDTLTYTAASSADAVATVSVDGSMVTVVGVAAGEAAVTVTATDPGDLSATQMFDVTVAVGNQSPEAVGTITGLAIAVGATEAVDVSGNFSDADSDTLTYTAASSADAVATVSVDGSMVTVVGVAAGEAAVTVTATDPGDLSATQMFDVTVAVGNQSPEAVGTITGLAIAVGATEAVDVSGNFSDADSDTLTYTAASSADAVATVSVDGSMVTVVGVAAGEAAVTVTATDPGDLSATQMFDVTVAVGNQSPEAVGTITGLAIAVGATEAVDVSGNFSDADSDTLTYTAASSADAVATVSVDGSMVTVVGVAAGEAAVTVTATDPGDLSATQMFDVTVAVGNQSPQAVGTIADQIIRVGDFDIVDVSVNFSDPDGDDADLTYTAASSTDAVATVSVVGSIVTYVAVAAGEADVTVTATDPGGLSATQTFKVTVTVTDQAPDDDVLTFTAASDDDNTATGGGDPTNGAEPSGV